MELLCDKASAAGAIIGTDLTPCPTHLRMEEDAYRLPAFVDARPENQSDAE